MPVVQYARTAHACQVEGIPSEVLDEKQEAGKDPVMRKFERSVEGSLHLRPGGTMVLTADEFDWLKKSKKSIFKNIRVLQEDPPPPKVEVAEPPAEPLKKKSREDSAKP